MAATTPATVASVVDGSGKPADFFNKISPERPYLSTQNMTSAATERPVWRALSGPLLEFSVGGSTLPLRHTVPHVFTVKMELFLGVADIAVDILRIAEEARDSAAEMLFEPKMALGVTGLSRAGKTVFITSLIANLMARARMGRLSVEADGRVKAVILQQHPDRERRR